MIVVTRLLFFLYAGRYIYICSVLHVRQNNNNNNVYHEYLKKNCIYFVHLIDYLKNKHEAAKYM